MGLASGGPAKVLIIDDDESSARALQEHVRDFGHEPIVANSWTEAIRAFGRGVVDLVLMDAVMPGVDGFKLTQMLRKRSSSYVPILFVTGLGDARSHDKGISAGADDFLNKPVNPAELRVRMRAMLRIRRLTTELEEKSRALERLAHVDPLTGLDNRRGFERRLAQELARSRRYGHPLSLLVLDIDHFKRVNDTFGHGVGDEVLASVGDMIREQARETDIAFRFGGEEFVILLPETPSSRACEVGERYRRVFRVQSSDTSAGIQTLSVGVASTESLPANAPSDQLFEAADQALYLAKARGRDRIHLIHPAELVAA